ncbi:hypothetical protein PSEUBRA_003296 [Kalmanozyma brasiliensis GHG001]|uniref:uncharacterized protein n=1 Tax=Kalmanozyma brasiliensis (strain GHG001) TaxID=1365824 RepID=UPI0028681641|nr:uncharacterized protein PSEUBRA_003296 [Kalmanozyma brasiliensis GHG001]KAF6767216.1 hypothetical protein PSEUBRA_003296 [Kalmanozyma brasiliensis GHG001]
MRLHSLRPWAIVTLLVAVLFALVSAVVPYTYPLQIVPSHGTYMGRTQFPSTLQAILSDGGIGKTRFHGARVTPLAHPVLSDTELIRALRADAMTRRLVVLGGPRFGEQGHHGFTAAFPVRTRYDSPNYKIFAFVSVVPGRIAPQVHVRGFASVENVGDVERLMAQHGEEYAIGHGTVTSVHELMSTLPYLL